MNPRLSRAVGGAIKPLYATTEAWKKQDIIQIKIFLLTLASRCIPHIAG